MISHSSGDAASAWPLSNVGMEGLVREERRDKWEEEEERGGGIKRSWWGGKGGGRGRVGRRGRERERGENEEREMGRKKEEREGEKRKEGMEGISPLWLTWPRLVQHRRDKCSSHQSTSISRWTAVSDMQHYGRGWSLVTCTSHDPVQYWASYIPLSQHLMEELPIYLPRWKPDSYFHHFPNVYSTYIMHILLLSDYK